MIKRYALSDEQLSAEIATLEGWSVVDGKLTKLYRFEQFANAIGWMVSAAIVIDKMDHHPEWSNVYNRVTVQLVTHDLGNKISSWDIALAKELDALV
ncbi:MAG: 4a-hydroxytetrahydrobiopterin dehydratase [Candidatus Promineifilaceae bacterium]